MAYRELTTKYSPQTIFGAATLDTDCWIWQGSMYRNGYGKIGKMGLMAHRLAYELARGHVPVDMCLDHLCKQRNCINPAHMEVVTLVENVMRGNSQHAINARKTHCIYGHELSGANLYIHPKRGSRLCRACRQRDDSRRSGLTKKENSK